MNILTLSTVFPNPTEVNFGLFVRARLQHMAESASIRVMAPVPLMNYRMRKTQFRPQIPLQREDGKLTVYHRRWVYPPMGGVFNAFFLFLQTLGIALRLNREAPVDIIDSHFAHPDGIAAALLALVLHLPFTVTLRGDETLHGSFRLRRAAMAWALRRAARVITVSEALMSKERSTSDKVVELDLNYNLQEVVSRMGVEKFADGRLPVRDHA